MVVRARLQSNFRRSKDLCDATNINQENVSANKNEETDESTRCRGHTLSATA